MIMINMIMNMILCMASTINSTDTEFRSNIYTPQELYVCFG